MDDILYKNSVSDIRIKEMVSEKSETPGEHNGHKYVDLGLPSGTLWAVMNIGAESETDNGLYFAWGETTGYPDLNSGKNFNWDDYTLTEDNGNTFTKYNKNDNKTILDSTDDAATVNLGGRWHMPTLEQFLELRENTTSQWVTNYNNSGVNGRLFTSNVNDSTLFFPASGFFNRYLSSWINEKIYIWSSTLTNKDNRAYELGIDPENVKIYDNTRFVGLAIRGVIE